MLRKRLRYADIEALGIVNNRVTLQNWIRNQDFPRGQLTGPNSRTWDEGEVAAWLKSRPTKCKPAQITKPEAEWKGRRGRRPRKTNHAEAQA